MCVVEVSKMTVIMVVYYTLFRVYCCVAQWGKGMSK